MGCSSTTIGPSELFLSEAIESLGGRTTAAAAPPLVPRLVALFVVRAATGVAVVLAEGVSAGVGDVCEIAGCAFVAD